MDVEFLKHKFEDGYVGVLTKTKLRIGIRHVQLLYMFAGAVVMGILRGSNGLSVLALTDVTRQNDSYIQVYDWSRRIQGTMLSSFIWGFTFMMVPAGIFVNHISEKFVLSAVLLINGSINVALPTIVNKGGWIAACNAQFIMGMTQAFLSPATQSLLDKWLPPYERSIFSGLVFGGIQVGVILSFPFCAAMSSAPLGWELVFYSLGMVALSSAAVWILLTGSSPHEHPAVGDKEKEYIDEALACYKKKSLHTPWAEIFKSSAFWGITFAHIGSNVVFVFFLVDIPAYLVYGLGKSIQESAWHVVLPLLALWVTHWAASNALSWLSRTGLIADIFSITHLRKFVNSFGGFGAAISLAMLSYVGPESGFLATLLLVAVLSLTGLQFVGFLENHHDISDNFSSTLLSISSVVANAAAASVPFVTGFIVNSDMTDLRSWRVVFLSVSAVCIASSVLYVGLSSSERQPWDCGPPRMKCAYYNDIIQLELEDFKRKNNEDKNPNVTLDLKD